MLSSLSLVIVLSLMPPISYAQNLAYNKTTFQSSTAIGGIASRAVDGIREGRFGLRSCTHTKESNRPWWAVDLGAEYQLESVLLMNRGDCCAWRLSDFIIGTIDGSPNVTAPTESSIRVCHRQSNALDKREVRSFNCTEKGRYVVVLRPRDRVYLTLCEVEVYGKPVVPIVAINLHIPNPYMYANQGDRVKFHCSFSLTANLPWTIEWYTRLPYDSRTTVLYTYSAAGRIDKPTISAIFRVSRDNISLILQEAVSSISERRICCKVSVPDPSGRVIVAEGCIQVTYIHFPDGALQCTDLNTKQAITNYPVYQSSPLVRARCSYINVHPACDIDVHNGSETGTRIAFARRGSAYKYIYYGFSGTAVYYGHGVDFQINLIGELMIHVRVRGDHIDRRKVLYYIHRAQGMDRSVFMDVADDGHSKSVEKGADDRPKHFPDVVLDPLRGEHMDKPRYAVIGGVVGAVFLVVITTIAVIDYRWKKMEKSTS